MKRSGNVTNWRKHYSAVKQFTLQSHLLVEDLSFRQLILFIQKPYSINNFSVYFVALIYPTLVFIKI